MQRFVDKYHLTFPNVNDDDGVLYNFLGVPGQPAWVFLKPDGHGQLRAGAQEPEQLDTYLGELLT